MDQIKIGKFIQEKRKEQKLTQSDLAEKLNITDRAVSKWENGKCLPDVSIMHNLCVILKITINDLFSGEIIDMKDNEKKLEEHLLEMTKLKEEKDKQLLRLETIIGLIVTISFLTLIFVSSFIEMDAWIRILLISIGFIIFVIGVGYAIGIEQTAGYYECQKCHYKYIPTYQSVLWAMHINRTRYMKCPKCNKRSWQKKIISRK
ncbi:MAG: helix-turn-helix transcriptional regulator [Mollicutes bacterium]|nr:helix-turn-helix transcriptional regulator [Mollicutes bacterium]